MHEQPGHERPGDSVPHQEEIEEVVEQHSLVKMVRVPLAFDTPDLDTTGVDVYTPTPGEWLLGLTLSVPITPFDGSSPTIQIGWQDDGGSLTGMEAGTPDNPQGNHLADTDNKWGLFGGDNPLMFTDTSPLQAWLDNSGGTVPPTSPESSEGEGDLILFIGVPS